MIVLGKPHQEWNCLCTECQKWRREAAEARKRAFELCKKVDGAHKAAENSELKF